LEASSNFEQHSPQPSQVRKYWFRSWSGL